VIPFLGGCRLAETDRTVARNYVTVLEEEGRSANTIRQAKVVLCAMFGMAVADGYVDYNPFHDVKIPKVPGRRAIKVATPEQYLTVRACLPNKPAQVFSTLLVSSGIRFCEAIGLRPADFDFEAAILEVARSVVKVSRQHRAFALEGHVALVREPIEPGHGFADDLISVHGHPQLKPEMTGFSSGVGQTRSQCGLPSAPTRTTSAKVLSACDARPCPPHVRTVIPVGDIA
jgi:integrase